MAFSFMSWCLWSCPEPEQSWAFPKGLGLFQRGLITIYYHFQKLTENPTTVRQNEERDIPGPWDNFEGKSCLAGSLLVPVAPEGTYWAPGAVPCEEELPCSFLSHPMTLSRTGCIPAAPDILQLQSVDLHLQKRLRSSTKRYGKWMCVHMNKN